MGELLDMKKFRERTAKSKDEVNAEIEFNKIIEAKKRNEERVKLDRQRDNERTGRNYKLPIKHSESAISPVKHKSQKPEGQ